MLFVAWFDVPPKHGFCEYKVTMWTRYSLDHFNSLLLISLSGHTGVRRCDQLEVLTYES